MISRSVCISNELVASSNTTIFGFFSNKRAIASRCFSPPESLRPRSPTIVLYPSGIRIMASWILADSAAFIASSSVASGQPYLILYIISSLNKTTS
mmetsp:Transcript_5845/g.9142  ORF Transcript_5845/g.9142 Transcript_5845/m.9142 type:complete len:96 (+) Transcript_5845:373-660(+)